ncbi:replication initiation factor domain-containing protein, partial [Pseudoalteromonas amylolytica]
MEYQYSDLAKKLIDNRVARFKKHDENQVIIDHLSFSFKLADLRHCKRAGMTGTTSETQTIFPPMPDIKQNLNTAGMSSDDAIKQIEREKRRVQGLLGDFYVSTLRVFCRFALGFELSAPRDKGFHGYQNSMNLLTLEGNHVGFVGIGGQRETCYIQISGEGCKHLWSHTTPFVLHHWLSKVLSISFLSRIDLARDCYDDVFNCANAETRFFSRSFARKKGGPNPTMSPRHSVSVTGDYDVEMITVGKRTSPVFWRIYNKKLEQGINEESLVWYRNEVELKKWNVDCLLDPDSAFAGICEFAQEMIETIGVHTSSAARVSKPATDLASRVKWVRRMCGKALADILEITEGDMST